MVDFPACHVSELGALVVMGCGRWIRWIPNTIKTDHAWSSNVGVDWWIVTYMMNIPYGSKDPLLGMHGRGTIWGVKYLLRYLDPEGLLHSWWLNQPI